MSKRLQDGLLLCKPHFVIADIYLRVCIRVHQGLWAVELIFSDTPRVYQHEAVITHPFVQAAFDLVARLNRERSKKLAQSAIEKAMNS